MPHNLREADAGDDPEAQTRKRTRTEELRSGTLFGRYVLRGSMLVIKDNLNAVSGYLSFSDSIANAPTSSGSGTGVYVDYTGIALSGASGDGSNPSYVKFYNASGVQIGKVIGEYGTGTDAGAASGVWTYGYSDTNGRTGNVGLRAIPFGAGHTGPGLDLYSTGVLAVDLRNGSDTTQSVQSINLSSQTSTTNAPQVLGYWDAYTSGTAAAGFGTTHLFRIEDNGGTIRSAMALFTVWDTATSASRRSRAKLDLYNVASANTVLSVPYFARIPAMYRKDTSGGAEVSNTTTETEIYSTTIEANELGTNGVIRLDIGGDLQQNSGGTINLTFRVKFGGTTIQNCRVAVQSFSGTGGWHLQCMLCNANSASSQRAYGSLVAGRSTVFSDTGADFGTASINTANDATLSVTVQWASADATAKVFSKSTFVELSPS